MWFCIDVVESYSWQQFSHISGHLCTPGEDEAETIYFKVTEKKKPSVKMWDWQTEESVLSQSLLKTQPRPPLARTWTRKLNDMPFLSYPSQLPFTAWTRLLTVPSTKSHGGHPPPPPTAAPHKTLRGSTLQMVGQIEMNDDGYYHSFIQAGRGIMSSC